MLGRFLEISVRAADVAESLAFYESLGFVQASVGDTWSHPYGVITDGRLHLGLHAREFEAPALTWVQPELASHARRLQALGIELAIERLGEDALHEVGFVDPSGQMITLLEARTFSPPALPPTHATQLGYFEEFGVPTGDLERATAFWDALGFVAFDPVRMPFTKVVAAGRDLNVGLYDVDLRNPVLTFSDPAMPERIAALRDQGHRFVERLPRGMNPRENALLEAPEGTWLLLTTEKVSGLQDVQDSQDPR
jgi:catechol 2,3-dioxygenase-like lactoylglutathione lyase family enzyme